jgi:mRNA-degrading endonuclease RelE of RelBE toxin-antitoxin system
VEAWQRDDLRELVVGNYRVVYQVTDREVWIVTVLHAGRMLPKSPEI